MEQGLVRDYVIPLLTIAVGVLTLIGTAYILRSLFLHVAIWNLDQKERLERYIQAKFDIKWPVYFLGVFALGIIISRLSLNPQLVKLNGLFFLLFTLLLWGNVNTLRMRRRILERLRKKSGSIT